MVLSVSGMSASPTPLETRQVLTGKIVIKKPSDQQPQSLQAQQAQQTQPASITQKLQKSGESTQAIKPQQPLELPPQQQQQQQMDAFKSEQSTVGLSRAGPSASKTDSADLAKANERPQPNVQAVNAYQALQQMGSTALAQANQQPQPTLSLLA